jgi:hypothetical protein
MSSEWLQLEVGRACASFFGLGIFADLKTLQNKSGICHSRAQALLNKQIIRASARARPTSSFILEQLQLG